MDSLYTQSSLTSQRPLPAQQPKGRSFASNVPLTSGASSISDIAALNNNNRPAAPRFGAGPVASADRKLLLGYFLQYGTPILATVLSLATGPFAIFAGLLSIPVVMALQKWGKNIIDKVPHGNLSKPTTHIRNMQTILDDPDTKSLTAENARKKSHPFQKLVHHWNEFVKSVTGKNPRIQNILLLTEKKKIIHTIANYGFHAIRLYNTELKNTFGAKVLSGARRIPVLRIPLTVLTVLTLALLKSRKIRKLIKASQAVN